MQRPAVLVILKTGVGSVSLRYPSRLASAIVRVRGYECPTAVSNRQQASGLIVAVVDSEAALVRNLAQPASAIIAVSKRSALWIRNSCQPVGGIVLDSDRPKSV